ncbi:MAG: AAA domain-containing protein [Elusimicrobiota bacterium]
MLNKIKKIILVGLLIVFSWTNILTAALNSNPYFRVHDFKKNGASPVIIFQDIHGHPEAQRNIATSFSLFRDKRPIGVEGGTGEFDFSLYHELPNSKITKDIASQFLNENKIAAAEYYGLTMPSEKLIGIETSALYLQHVDVYKKANLNQQKIKKELNGWGQELLEKEKKYYPSSLFNLIQVQESYLNKKQSLTEYIKVLSEFEDLPLSLETFLVTVQLEKGLNFKNIQNDKDRFIEQLAVQMSSKEKLFIRELVLQVSNAEGKWSGPFSILFRYAADRGIKLNKFPHLNDYYRYLSLVDSLKMESIYDELSLHEESVFESLLKKCPPLAHNIFKARQYKLLLQKLAQFEMTPQEWDKWEKRKAPLDLNSMKHIPISLRDQSLLAPFEDFYRIADLRSADMVKHIIKNKLGRVVLGGFHTQKIENLLKANNVDYSVVRPKITSLKFEDTNIYLSAFAQKESFLEKFFLRWKLFLSHPIQMGTAPLLKMGDPVGEFEEVWMNKANKQEKKIAKPLFQKIKSTTRKILLRPSVKETFQYLSVFSAALVTLNPTLLVLGVFIQMYLFPRNHPRDGGRIYRTVMSVFVLLSATGVFLTAKDLFQNEWVALSFAIILIMVWHEWHIRTYQNVIKSRSMKSPLTPISKIYMAIHKLFFGDNIFLLSVEKFKPIDVSKFDFDVDIMSDEEFGALLFLVRLENIESVINLVSFTEQYYELIEKTKNTKRKAELEVVFADGIDILSRKLDEVGSSGELKIRFDRMKEKALGMPRSFSLVDNVIKYPSIILNLVNQLDDRQFSYFLKAITDANPPDFNVHLLILENLMEAIKLDSSNLIKMKLLGVFTNKFHAAMAYLAKNEKFYSDGNIDRIEKLLTFASDQWIGLIHEDPDLIRTKSVYIDVLVKYLKLGHKLGFENKIAEKFYPRIRSLLVYENKQFPNVYNALLKVVGMTPQLIAKKSDFSVLQDILDREFRDFLPAREEGMGPLPGFILVSAPGLLEKGDLRPFYEVLFVISKNFQELHQLSAERKTALVGSIELIAGIFTLINRPEISELLQVFIEELKKDRPDLSQIVSKSLLLSYQLKDPKITQNILMGFYHWINTNSDGYEGVKIISDFEDTKKPFCFYNKAFEKCFDGLTNEEFQPFIKFHIEGALNFLIFKNNDSYLGQIKFGLQEYLEKLVVYDGRVHFSLMGILEAVEAYPANYLGNTLSEYLYSLTAPFLNVDWIDKFPAEVFKMSQYVLKLSVSKKSNLPQLYFIYSESAKKASQWNIALYDGKQSYVAINFSRLTKNLTPQELELFNYDFIPFLFDLYRDRSYSLVLSYLSAYLSFLEKKSEFKKSLSNRNKAILGILWENSQIKRESSSPDEQGLKRVIDAIYLLLSDDDRTLIQEKIVKRLFMDYLIELAIKKSNLKYISVAQLIFKDLSSSTSEGFSTRSFPLLNGLEIPGDQDLSTLNPFLPAVIKQDVVERNGEREILNVPIFPIVDEVDEILLVTKKSQINAANKKEGGDNNSVHENWEPSEIESISIYSSSRLEKEIWKSLHSKDPLSGLARIKKDLVEKTPFFPWVSKYISVITLIELGLNKETPDLDEVFKCLHKLVYDSPYSLAYFESISFFMRDLVHIDWQFLKPVINKFMLFQGKNIYMTDAEKMMLSFFYFRLLGRIEDDELSSWLKPASEELRLFLNLFLDKKNKNIVFNPAPYQPMKNIETISYVLGIPFSSDDYKFDDSENEFMSTWPGVLEIKNELKLVYRVMSGSIEKGNIERISTDRVKNIAAKTVFSDLLEKVLLMGELGSSRDYILALRVADLYSRLFSTGKGIENLTFYSHAFYPAVSHLDPTGRWFLDAISVSSQMLKLIQKSSPSVFRDGLIASVDEILEKCETFAKNLGTYCSALLSEEVSRVILSGKIDQDVNFIVEINKGSFLDFYLSMFKWEITTIIKMLKRGIGQNGVFRDFLRGNFIFAIFLLNPTESWAHSLKRLRNEISAENGFSDQELRIAKIFESFFSSEKSSKEKLESLVYYVELSFQNSRTKVAEGFLFPFAMLLALVKEEDPEFVRTVSFPVFEKLAQKNDDPEFKLKVSFLKYVLDNFNDPQKLLQKIEEKDFCKLDPGEKLDLKLILAYKLQIPEAKQYMLDFLNGAPSYFQNDFSLHNLLTSGSIFPLFKDAIWAYTKNYFQDNDTSWKTLSGFSEKNMIRLLDLSVLLGYTEAGILRYTLIKTDDERRRLFNVMTPDQWFYLIAELIKEKKIKEAEEQLKNAQVHLRGIEYPETLLRQVEALLKPYQEARILIPKTAEQLRGLLRLENLGTLDEVLRSVPRYLFPYFNDPKTVNEIESFISTLTYLVDFLKRIDSITDDESIKKLLSDIRSSPLNKTHSNIAKFLVKVVEGIGSFENEMIKGDLSQAEQALFELDGILTQPNLRILRVDKSKDRVKKSKEEIDGAYLLLKDAATQKNWFGDNGVYPLIQSIFKRSKKHKPTRDWILQFSTEWLKQRQKEIGFNELKLIQNLVTIILETKVFLSGEEGSLRTIFKGFIKVRGVQVLRDLQSNLSFLQLKRAAQEYKQEKAGQVDTPFGQVKTVPIYQFSSTGFQVYVDERTRKKYLIIKELNLPEPNGKKMAVFSASDGSLFTKTNVGIIKDYQVVLKIPSKKPMRVPVLFVGMRDPKGSISEYAKFKTFPPGIIFEIDPRYSNDFDLLTVSEINRSTSSHLLRFIDDLKLVAQIRSLEKVVDRVGLNLDVPNTGNPLLNEMLGLQINLANLEGVFSKGKDNGKGKTTPTDNPRIPESSLQFANDKLDPFQQSAVKKIIKKVKKGQPGFMVVQGSPGSGKTTLSAEEAHQLTKEGHIVVALSHTHFAANNLAKKLINKIPFIRAAAVDKKIVKSLRGYHSRRLKDLWEFIEKREMALKLRQTPPGFVYISTADGLFGDPIFKLFDLYLTGAPMNDVRDYYSYLSNMLMKEKIIFDKNGEGEKSRSYTPIVLCLEESGQLTKAEELAAMELLRADVLYSIGDHDQLPPYGANLSDKKEILDQMKQGLKIFKTDISLDADFWVSHGVYVTPDDLEKLFAKDSPYLTSTRVSFLEEMAESTIRWMEILESLLGKNNGSVSADSFEKLRMVYRGPWYFADLLNGLMPDSSHGELLTYETAENRTPLHEDSLMIIHEPKGIEEKTEEGSLRNFAEAGRVVQAVTHYLNTKLLRPEEGEFPFYEPKDILIITPYSAQNALIGEVLTVVAVLNDLTTKQVLSGTEWDLFQEILENHLDSAQGRNIVDADVDKIWNLLDDVYNGKGIRTKKVEDIFTLLQPLYDLNLHEPHTRKISRDDVKNIFKGEEEEVEEEKKNHIEVRTVDSSQGHEGPVVILSMVRSNKPNEIGFLASKEGISRFYVAASRFQERMAVVGNFVTLEKYGIYKRLIQTIRRIYKSVGLEFKAFKSPGEPHVKTTKSLRAAWDVSFGNENLDELFDKNVAGPVESLIFLSMLGYGFTVLFTQGFTLGGILFLLGGLLIQGVVFPALHHIKSNKTKQRSFKNDVIFSWKVIFLYVVSYTGFILIGVSVEWAFWLSLIAPSLFHNRDNRAVLRRLKSIVPEPESLGVGAVEPVSPLIIPLPGVGPVDFDRGRYRFELLEKAA